MNWKTIKTFLIFLFLAVDIFLIALTYNSYNSAKLSDSSISDTLSILQNNGIVVADASVIPRNAATRHSIQLTNIYFSDIVKIHKPKIMAVDNNQISVELPCTMAGINHSNATDMIKSALNKYGFDTKNTSITTGENNHYKMTYKVNGLPVFNNEVDVTVNSDSVVLCGTWYLNETKSTYTGGNTGSCYATSALIAFLSHPQRDKSKTTTITDIDLGYYAIVGDGTENIKIITASTCYRLTTDDNKVYYYSIQENKFIN